MGVREERVSCRCVWCFPGGLPAFGPQVKFDVCPGCLAPCRGFLCSAKRSEVTTAMGRAGCQARLLWCEGRFFCVPLSSHTQNIVNYSNLIYRAVVRNECANSYMQNA